MCHYSTSEVPVMGPETKKKRKKNKQMSVPMNKKRKKKSQNIQWTATHVGAFIKQLPKSTRHCMALPQPYTRHRRDSIEIQTLHFGYGWVTLNHPGVCSKCRRHTRGTVGVSVSQASHCWGIITHKLPLQRYQPHSSTTSVSTVRQIYFAIYKVRVWRRRYRSVLFFSFYLSLYIYLHLSLSRSEKQSHSKGYMEKRHRTEWTHNTIQKPVTTVREAPMRL